MITGDPKKSKVYHLATLQLRNVFDAALWERVIRGRWILTAGFLVLMAASLPACDTHWYRDVLFFLGCGLGLAAAFVSRTGRKAMRPKIWKPPADEPL